MRSICAISSCLKARHPISRLMKFSLRFMLLRLKKSLRLKKATQQKSLKLLLQNRKQKKAKLLRLIKKQKRNKKEVHSFLFQLVFFSARTARNREEVNEVN